MAQELDAAKKAAARGDQAAAVALEAVQEMQGLRSTLTAELDVETEKVRQLAEEELDRQQSEYEARLAYMAEVHAHDREMMRQDQLWWQQERRQLLADKARLQSEVEDARRGTRGASVPASAPSTPRGIHYDKLLASKGLPTMGQAVPPYQRRLLTPR